MESRLSDAAMIRKYDRGHSTLAWDVPPASGLLAGIDFDRILTSPEAQTIIRSLPVQPLYMGLRQKGLEESGEILAKLSADQLTRLLDFDVWPEDRLDRQRVWEWLDACSQPGPKIFCEKFIHLEEELQIALLQGRLELVEEDSMEIPVSGDQDDVYGMPCGTVFYRIRTDSDVERASIEKLLEALKEENLRYAYSLIAYASGTPPGEAEFTLGRFRQARLEEEGFVPYEEAQEMFVPASLEGLRRRWQGTATKNSGSGNTVAPRDEGPAFFMDRVMLLAHQQGWSVDDQYTVHQGLMHLANGLCAATRVEPDDRDGLNRVLEQARGLTSLGLEILANGSVESGLVIIKGESAKNLFRAGVAGLAPLRTYLLERLRTGGLAGIDQAARGFERDQYGSVILQIENAVTGVFGLQVSEILKGIFNRFPMKPVLAEDNPAGPMRFAPIGSRAELEEMIAWGTAIGALLHLYTAFNGGAQQAGMDIVRPFRTAAVRAITGGDLRADALSTGEMSEFLLMDEAARQKAWARVAQLAGDILQADQKLWDLPAPLAEPVTVSHVDVARFLLTDEFKSLLSIGNDCRDDLARLVRTEEAQ